MKSTDAMIFYNVTINIEESAHESWLKYMKEEHIPDVMSTGCFVGYTFSRVLSQQEDETGMTYAILYKCNSMTDYDDYMKNFAEGLRQDVLDKYAGKFVAFRTLLEEVS